MTNKQKLIAAYRRRLRKRGLTLKHYRTCRTDSGECFDVMDGHKILKSFEHIENLEGTAE